MVFDRLTMRFTLSISGSGACPPGTKLSSFTVYFDNIPMFFFSISLAFILSLSKVFHNKPFDN